MKRFIVIISFITNSSFGLESKLSIDKKWDVLFHLVNQEISTIKKNRYESIEIEHRLFELYSEKLKLIREKENKALINTATSNNNKSNVFNESTELYLQTVNFGLSLLKKYPNYKQKNYLYYAMAINSRDFSDGKITEEFLREAIKYSQNDPKTNYKAKVALAEFYYNEKKYLLAIDYYEEVLKNKDDEWFSKHLYNAGWCYFKIKNYNQALNYVKESYTLSSNPKYISLKAQIIESIGLFFVWADKADQAISFFKKETKPSSPYLINLAKSTLNKNNFPEAIKILAQAEIESKKETDKNLQLKVLNSELEIFQSQKSEELFYETNLKIRDFVSKNKELSKEEVQFSINKIKEIAGSMQATLSNKKENSKAEYSEVKYKKILDYFETLCQIDHVNKIEYRYFQGETSLSIENFESSIKFYGKAISLSKKAKSISIFFEKSVASYLVALDEMKQNNQKDLHRRIFALKNYLIKFPQGTLSQQFYQKLFNIYLELKDTKRMANTFYVYHLNYPTDIELQKKMLTQILDLYIINKKTQSLAYWIPILEKGFLKFDKAFIDKTTETLGFMLFNSCQELEKSGNQALAVKGYKDIFKTTKYPIKVRADAAYALSVLSIKRNQIKDSSEWLSESLKLYSAEEISKIALPLTNLIKDYALGQEEEMALSFIHHLNLKLCHSKFAEKDEMANMEADYMLLTNQYSHFLDFIEKENLCLNNEHFVKDKITQLVSYYIFNQDIESIIKLEQSYAFIHDLSSVHDFKRFIFWKNPNLERNALLCDECSIEWEKLKEIDSLILSYSPQLIESEEFIPDQFNQKLDRSLVELNNISQKQLSLLKHLSEEAQSYLRSTLTVPFTILTSAIQNIPVNKIPQEIREDFFKEMRQITESLNAKSSKIESQNWAFLSKNNFFYEIQKYARVSKNLNQESLGNQNQLHVASIYASTLDNTKN